MSLPAVHKLTYAPYDYGEGPVVNQFQTGLIDIFRDLSSYNSKHFPYTTNDGHLLGAYVDVTIKSSVPLSGEIVGVQNSWKLRNSFRKFHFKRMEMFENAGVEGEELGTYGKTIRPFFDLMDFMGFIQGGGTLDFWNRAQYYPKRVTSAMSGGSPVGTEFELETMLGGDWDRSVVASATPGADGDIGYTDEWFLHICDGHATGTGKGAYDSVGMIQAYNEDRMEVVTPDSSESITGQNPLALLTAQTIAGGAVSAIAEDQEEEAPPYDITDFGDSIHKSVIDVFRAAPNTAGDDNVSTYTIRNVWCPAGYLGFLWDQAPSDLQNAMEIVVDVKSVWECRELA